MREALAPMEWRVPGAPALAALVVLVLLVLEGPDSSDRGAMPRGERMSSAGPAVQCRAGVQKD